MKLLIVSDMPHYETIEGITVGWGPTVQEIDHLAELFDDIEHIGFLYPGLPPDSMLPYVSPKVKFFPLQPSGGARFWDKLGILAKVSAYFSIIFKCLQTADVLHVRCPSNVGLMLMVLLAILPSPKYRWVKYAGNWQPTAPEGWSYTFQRWWLNLGLHRGSVTVNGSWKSQPSHVYSFLNPSLLDVDLEAGRLAALNKTLTLPIQVVFVGRVETAKGCGRLLEISRRLLVCDLDFHVHIIGDGEERPAFERLVIEKGLKEKVEFHGWISHSKLFHFYEKAHFFVLPTAASEGWPKVLSEGMAYGVVPLAGAVSSIPQILQEFETGMALNSRDTQAFVNAILAYVNEPERWLRESQAACDAAYHFTYASYMGRVKTMFLKQWNVSIT